MQKDTLADISHRYIGKTFGRLTVLKRDRTAEERPYWVCKCQCGNKTKVRSDVLNTGRTKSCGCLLVDKQKAKKKKH